MEVVYGEKKWTFENEMLLDKLLQETGLKREPVLVMADGRLIREGETLPRDSRVLIINAANGG
jgi:sulfur carrier protein ThiS